MIFIMTQNIKEYYDDLILGPETMKKEENEEEIIEEKHIVYKFSYIIRKVLQLMLKHLKNGGQI